MLKGAQQPAQGRDPPLFIAPKPNRAVGAKWLVSVRAPDTVVLLLTVEFQWLETSPDRGGGGTTLGVVVTTQANSGNPCPQEK
jgi:hypothetical protein